VRESNRSFHFQLDRLIAEGDFVVARWTIRAEPAGAMGAVKRVFGVRGPVEFVGVNIARVRDGRIVEIWNHRDDLAFVEQIGIAPFLATAGFAGGMLVAALGVWGRARLRRRRTGRGARPAAGVRRSSDMRALVRTMAASLAAALTTVAAARGGAQSPAAPVPAVPAARSPLVADVRASPGISWTCRAPDSSGSTSAAAASRWCCSRASATPPGSGASSDPASRAKASAWWRSRDAPTASPRRRRAATRLDTLAADVVAFLDSLAIPRAHLVGHSLAGAELTRVASRYPDRVRRLVYVDAAYDRAAQQRYDSLVPEPRLGPAITAPDRASVDAYLAYQRRARLDLARFWGAAVERDYRASLVADSLGRVRWRHPLARYGEILRDASRAAPEYAGVRAPALALYATVPTILPAGASAEQRAQVARFERENSEPWTAESVAQFRTGVRGGRVERIAGVHHLFLDRPHETLRAIVRFLRASGPESRR
jgi:pimeloyl-ACP methyl ester carboxylesterase